MKTVIHKGQWFTSWQCTKPIDVIYHDRMETWPFPFYYMGISSEEINGFGQVSPIKRHFVDEGRFMKSPYPEHVAFDRLMLLQESARVDYSSFYDYPTDSTFYARCFIHSTKAQSLPLVVVSYGSVKAWVNKKEAFAFPSCSTNIEMQNPCSIDLAEGVNELVIGCNDIGERNTMLCFGLCNLGTDLEVSLPIDDDEKSFQALGAFAASIEMTESDAGLEFTFSPADKDISLKVNDGSSFTDILEIPRGSRAVSSLHRWSKRFMSVEACLGQLALRRTFYRFSTQKPVVNIPASEKARKKLYIDTLLEKGDPSPALFIAGLSRHVNLFEKCKKQVLDSMERIERRADCSDFRMTEIIWMYALGQDILPKELIDRFKALMINYRYWFDEPGNDVMWFFSENHALAFHACEFIAGSLFPDEIFVNSGMTGRQHSSKARALIKAWFSSLFAYGYNEYSSVNYIPVDMLGYATLLMFSHDQEIESLCIRAFDMTFELLALQCHKGMLLGANGRAYPDDLLSPTCLQANAFCYFAWGTEFSPLAYRPTLYALCPYESPASIREKALWNKKEPLSERLVQGVANVQTTIVKTSSYFIGSSVSPLSGKIGSQEHLLDIMVGDEGGRMWINHPGEGVLFGTRRPGYFNGNGYTPMVSQCLASAVVSYRFSEKVQAKSEIGYTHLICFRNRFEKQVLEKCDLFLRRDGVNVFVHADNGLEIPSQPLLCDMELRSPGLWNTWYVRLDDSMSFDDFVKAMKTCSVKRDKQIIWVHDPVYGMVRYTTMDTVDE